MAWKWGLQKRKKSEIVYMWGETYYMTKPVYICCMFDVVFAISTNILQLNYVICQKKNPLTSCISMDF